MTVTRAEMIMNMSGNVARQARRNEQALTGMAKRSSNRMRLLDKSIRATGRGLDRLGNRYTAILTGAGAALASKQVVELGARYTMLGVQARITEGKVDALKQKIFETARADDVRLAPENLLSAVEKIVEKTGDLDFAEKSLRSIALAIRATNSEGQHIGAFVADLMQKYDIKDEGTLLAVLDGIIVQGKTGAFTLANLATQGERVTAAYAAAGRVGPKAVKEMGAMLQMIKQGTSDRPEQTATAFEAYLRTLQDADKIKQLEGVGLKIFEDDDPNKMRSIIDITKDLMNLSGGSIKKLSTIFDSEAIRALNSSAIEFKKNAALPSLDAFYNVHADGSEILEDAATNANTAAAALTSLASTLEKLADDKMTGPIQSLTDTLNSLSAVELDTLANGLLAVGGGLVGLVLASKAIKGGVALSRGLKALRSGGLAGAVDAAGGKIGGIQQVYVTNMPAGGMAGEYAGRGKNARTGRKLTGRFKSSTLAASVGTATGASGTAARGLLSGGTGLLKGAGKGLAGLFKRVPLLGAILTAGSIASTASASDLTGEQKAKSIGGDLGGLGGALAGSAAGAALGSVIPGIGTLIGGVLGGIAGGFGGAEAGGEITELLMELITATKENGNNPPVVDVTVNEGNNGPKVYSQASRRHRRVPNIHNGPNLGVGQ